VTCRRSLNHDGAAGFVRVLGDGEGRSALVAVVGEVLAQGRVDEDLGSRLSGRSSSSPMSRLFFTQLTTRSSTASRSSCPGIGRRYLLVFMASKVKRRVDTRLIHS
jgi:hypothetical protein